jgi:hypothetical protein
MRMGDVLIALAVAFLWGMACWFLYGFAKAWWRDR